MAQVHGRNAVLWIWDNAGTCRNLSGDFNSIVLNYTRDNPDTTTLGKDSHQRISGLRDAVLTGAAVWNGGGNAVDTTLQGLLNGSTISLVNFAPGGSVSSCPLYAACMLINSYQVTTPVNGVVAATFSFQLASGSLTASTVA